MPLPPLPEEQQNLLVRDEQDNRPLFPGIGSGSYLLARGLFFRSSSEAGYAPLIAFLVGTVIFVTVLVLAVRILTQHNPPCQHEVRLGNSPIVHVEPCKPQTKH